MFGSEARIGLTSSSLPNELMSTIESEADLFAVFEDDAETEDVTLQSCDTDMQLPLLIKNKPRGW